MKELILMKCNECGATENYFDERMGERVCSDCGLVLVQEIFEQNVHILNKTGDVVHSADNGKLGSIVSGRGSSKFNKFGKNSVTPKNVQNGLMHCNMTLAAIAPQTPERRLLFCSALKIAAIMNPNGQRQSVSVSPL